MSGPARQSVTHGDLMTLAGRHLAAASLTLARDAMHCLIFSPTRDRPKAGTR